jgi:hypothetical protein
VHAWHGKIRCRSRESVYTVFALEFPHPRRAQAGEPSTAPPVSAST